MQTLKGNIRVVDMLPIAVYTGDQTSAAIDMHQDIGYGTALVTVSVGNITGTPTSLKVTIIESDAANMAGATPVLGGSELTVAADTLYKFEIERKKRYVAVLADFTGGTTPTAELHAIALLNNWARPYPVV